jgi:hypothetical protein
MIGLKKNLKKFLEPHMKKDLLEANSEVSIKRQIELLGFNRSSYYYAPQEPSEADIEQEELIKAKIDIIHTKQCYLG